MPSPFWPKGLSTRLHLPQTTLVSNLEIAARRYPDKPAYVVFVVPQAADAERLQRELSFATLIFARQWFRIVALVNDLDIQDRVRGLVAALA
ncbi:MAG: hypothetical protein B7Z02_18250, partial [Rhodobacterales bacterium 32-67-9]